MSSNPNLEDSLRAAILAKPDAVLEDTALMQALVSANDRAMGDNIVDLRGIAMERLEARLDRLEDTHRSVIAAAYENLAGTNQIHRAILRLLEPMEFEAFLRAFGNDVGQILRVERMVLLLETSLDQNDPSVNKLDGVLRITGPGFVERYMAGDRRGPARPVVMRPTSERAADVYGDDAGRVRSEACLKLDLGPGRLPGMIAMGSAEPDHFSPQLGTDLLAFFAGVFERSMRHWLS